MTTSEPCAWCNGTGYQVPVWQPCRCPLSCVKHDIFIDSLTESLILAEFRELRKATAHNYYEPNDPGAHRKAPDAS